MTSKHTPGPWVVSHPWMGFSQIVGNGRAFVFGLAAGSEDEKQPDDVCDANARLIAAAPDLLAALKEALPHIGVGYSGIQRHAIITQVNAAIAKAEGRP